MKKLINSIFLRLQTVFLLVTLSLQPHLAAVTCQVCHMFPAHPMTAFINADPITDDTSSERSVSVARSRVGSERISVASNSTVPSIWVDESAQRYLCSKCLTVEIYEAWHQDPTHACPPGFNDQKVAVVTMTSSKIPVLDSPTPFLVLVLTREELDACVHFPQKRSKTPIADGMAHIRPDVYGIVVTTAATPEAAFACCHRPEKKILGFPNAIILAEEFSVVPLSLLERHFYAWENSYLSWAEHWRLMLRPSYREFIKQVNHRDLAWPVSFLLIPASS